MNKVKLQQTPPNTRLDREIRVTNCIIAWSLKNVRHGVNDRIVVDGTITQIPQGYYTFTDLTNTLKTHGITISKLLNNHVELTSEKDLSLKDFGELLGFEENKTITKNTKYTSIVSASLTNRLKDIHLYCSLVDSDRNFSYVKTGYFRSNLLTSLPIDTHQPLNGNFTKYDMGHLRLPCRNFSGQDIEFDVESGGHHDDYEIYLTLEIN